MTTAEYKDLARYWKQLEAQKPQPHELVHLLRHLQWLRLSSEAKLRTEFLPGMGRRRGDQPDCPHRSGK